MSAPFDTVLVANRGEIARRVFRTARAMGHRCVAVYVDADAGAPFVAEADEAVRLETGYLDGAAVIAAARATGAGAIHPGYGFLSENAGFAADVLAAGLVWVGPTPEVIAAMGDKLAAKKAAVAAGVPTLPSSDDPRDGDAVGYPLLVKAAAGGGGKGMRVVDSAADLAEAVAGAQREALSGFGDDRVFLERYVRRARHVEIQILGDEHGNLLHLGERECSVQRRHQKIVEESPSPVVDDALRTAMGEAALALAGSLGYRSAGTVEFLVDDDTREFFFLEVNTRLQVEHPVTEEVTGIDLVREQLRVAAGERLDHRQDDVAFRGHAIEVRLYAEDPAAGFLPATGTVAAFAPAAEPVVRWDSGVEAGSVVGVSFDPMLAKVVAHAPTRREAAGRLALALERLHLGGLTTNRDFLVAVLRHPAFLAGDTTTDFIERHAPAAQLVLADDELCRATAAAALWLRGRNRAEARVLRSVPAGWRNARLPDSSVRFRHRDDEVEVRYRARRDGTVTVRDVGDARVLAWTADGIDVEIGGRRARYAVTADGERLLVQTPRGTVDLDVVPRFVPPGAGAVEGGFVAPMPGVVLDVRCAVGDRVTSGQTLVLLEAMKMEHHVKAPFDGVVTEVRAAVGDQVDNGAVLLVVEPEEEGSDG
ncbi:biotin carboxylase N-terminal domain-containing protein [Blastococcus sp. CCUG 61487]|uniref:ATP-binding protein n=1 Tax=Blastococcus sp. CCUG 61487 TaxID=1840703 RepID=UPI0011336079|nr:biotin carboxylase N-terminal domain-containing protein [Blastococcus sp. CCUG 61487]TKJ32127.1 carbamoyl-phosphate synthase L chain ATP-binding protein [Blastococcus sp. CCUG 61487]